jgi:adenosylcobinamide kinase/adenosylcobinamide-phosphate guanylyltransferase
MAHITFITGGQRSGKSAYAQKLALSKADNPLYLATARIWDDDFKERIKRHQRDRGENWENLEEEKYISRHNLTGKTVVLDCITLWLTNFFHDTGYDVNLSLEEVKKEWDCFIRQDFNLIVVSNEIGMGTHADTDVGRKFTDLQGWMNQYIAATANKVILMISGIPLTIK